MEITQRMATLSDADLLLTWRNNLRVREFSTRLDLIPIEEHLKWLTNRLQRVPLEPFLLFEASNKEIGMSRLDRILESTERYEISILVDPLQHSKGLGTRILKMTCEYFFSLYPDSTIIAKVHNRNIASLKLFSNAGFQLRTRNGDFHHLEKTLKLGQ